MVKPGGPLAAEVNDWRRFQAAEELHDQFAKYWLKKGASDSKTKVFSPEARKMPYHRCVCDEKDEPIGAAGRW